MWQQICLVMSFILISAVVSLPLSYVQTFHIEQSFGFNRMTVGLWLTDMLKGVLLGAALGLPLLWLVLYLMQSGGAWWWMIAWGVLVVYQLFVMWLAPSVIMPLFNKFQPLEDASLKDPV
jgi:STE24 endopeptidase